MSSGKLRNEIEQKEMHKSLLAIFLVTASGSAMADWIAVSHSEADTFYADAATIIKSTYKVKMQSLHDYKTAVKVAGVLLQSTVVQEEYDCLENRTRALFYSFYSKNMGKGRSVHTDSEPHEWKPVRPGSIRETLWTFACKKKPGN
jgi:hypothetical protein